MNYDRHTSSLCWLEKNVPPRTHPSDTPPPSVEKRKVYHPSDQVLTSIKPSASKDDRSKEIEV